MTNGLGFAEGTGRRGSGAQNYRASAMVRSSFGDVTKKLVVDDGAGWRGVPCELCLVPD